MANKLTKEQIQQNTASGYYCGECGKEYTNEEELQKASKNCYFCSDECYNANTKNNITRSETIEDIKREAHTRALFLTEDTREKAREYIEQFHSEQSKENKKYLEQIYLSTFINKIIL